MTARTTTLLSTPVVLDDAATALDGLLQSLLGAIEPIASDLNYVSDVPLADESAADDLAANTRKAALGARTPMVGPARVDTAADTEFSVLRFGWEDLEVAVPLAALECVAASPGTVSRLPGQSNRHLGMVTVRGRRRVIVDLRRCIGLAGSGGATANLTASGFVLALAEGRYAMHCTKLGSAQRVGPTDITWRRTTGATPWVAAVLNDGLCTLLDTEWLSNEIRHD